MKSVLISIRPQWCEKIANGEKTVEVRKTRPKLETPFKCYIYCTKDNTDRVPSRIWWKTDKTGFQHILNGKAIGEFVCDQITYFGNVATDPWKYLLGSVHEEHKRLITEKACLTEEEILQYKGRYGWHISDLKIYDTPKKLGEFRQCHKCEYHEGCDQHEYSCDGYYNLRRPPQSWCYVEGGEGDG